MVDDAINIDYEANAAASHPVREPVATSYIGLAGERVESPVAASCTFKPGDQVRHAASPGLRLVFVSIDRNPDGWKTPTARCRIIRGPRTGETPSYMLSELAPESADTIDVGTTDAPEPWEPAPGSRWRQHSGPEVEVVGISSPACGHPGPRLVVYRRPEGGIKHASLAAWNGTINAGGRCVRRFTRTG